MSKLECDPCRECGEPGEMNFFKGATPVKDEEYWSLCFDHVKETLLKNGQEDSAVYYKAATQGTHFPLPPFRCIVCGKQMGVEVSGVYVVDSFCSDECWEQRQDRDDDAYMRIKFQAP